MTIMNDVVPEEYASAAMDLYKMAEEVQGRRDFALQLDGIRVRVVKTKSSDGSAEYCFRRLPMKIPELEDLNYEMDFLEEAIHWGQRKGLVLTIGETGSGKTTLIMSLLQHWTDTIGGVFLTIEDPVEFRLPKHGHGFRTIQWEVTTKEEWPVYVNNCLRYAPNIILCGEIRTPETAEAVLNLANSGHMVIASVHGSSNVAGLQRLIQTAQASDLGESASAVLAEAFTGSVHQQIVQGRPIVEFLATTRNPKETDPLREYIRKGEMKMIPGIIERQRNLRDAKARRATVR
jgi:Tfp pilus assembly pilus retraction ATPase PilT